MCCRKMKEKKHRWYGHTKRKEDGRNAYEILDWVAEGRRRRKDKPLRELDRWRPRKAPRLLAERRGYSGWIGIEENISIEEYLKKENVILIRERTNDVKKR